MDDIASAGPITVAALFDRREDADAAASRLRAAGLMEESVRIRQGSGDHAWNLEHGAIPEQDIRQYDAALSAGRVLVIAATVPHELHAEVVGIFEDATTDHVADDDPENRPEGEGAIGTLGGAGRATGEVDRLTGESTGAPDADAPDAGDGGWGGAGSATGRVDRLTGETIGRDPDVPPVRSYQTGAALAT